MAEEKDEAKGVVAELTPEEQKVLAKALPRVETDIYNRVLKRISVWTGIVVSILLIGGLINMNACSTNIETSTVQKLANDPELRDKIITRAQVNLAEIQERIKTLNEHAEALERDNARAAAAFRQDLGQIRLMLDRIEEELSEGLAPQGDGTQGSGNRSGK